MKALAQSFGKFIGIRFAPDNKIVPVLRWEQFNRVEKGGYFWINPFIEEALPPISVGLQVGNFAFNEVLTADNIPFTVKLTVLFQFDPSLPPPSVLAQVVRLPANKLSDIVEDYASQGLRRLASTFTAEELGGKTAVSQIENSLRRFLKAQLNVLGLVPLRQGGILVKEVIAPEKFKQAMLHVHQHQATLQMLSHYPEKLIEQAIRTDFLTGLEDHSGNLTLFSSLDGGTILPGLLNNGHTNHNIQNSKPS
jgi:regulator of protease activity HflC (stomatin/prohibitin superfamily)